MTIRTSSATYTSPRRLKSLATAVIGAGRPEIIRRSHASSSRWTRMSVAGKPRRMRLP